MSDLCECCDNEIESMTNAMGAGYCGCSNACPFCVWCCPTMNDSPDDEEDHVRFCTKANNPLVRFKDGVWQIVAQKVDTFDGVEGVSYAKLYKLVHRLGYKSPFRGLVMWTGDEAFDYLTEMEVIALVADFSGQR